MWFLMENFFLAIFNLSLGKEYPIKFKFSPSKITIHLAVSPAETNRMGNSNVDRGNLFVERTSNSRTTKELAEEPGEDTQRVTRSLPRRCTSEESRVLTRSRSVGPPSGFNPNIEQEQRKSFISTRSRKHRGNVAIRKFINWTKLIIQNSIFFVSFLHHVL